ncbi:3801_t:CDS:1, partial [Cetraspora pellucida]
DNNDENSKKYPKYLSDFSKEISDSYIYRIGVAKFLTKKLINLFSNLSNDDNDIQEKFLKSRHINLIISHKEDIHIKKFIKLKKKITLDVTKDIQQFNIKNKRKNVSKEEREVNSIIEKMDNLNLPNEKEKYIKIRNLLK